MIDDIKKLKGFMPHHEGLALLKWSETFSKYGPIIEIGTYCGKSSAYLAYGAIKNNQVVYTIDHHSGSEEHQINEEYFDEEVYDESNKRIDTFPIFKMNMEKLGIENVIPVVAESELVSRSWQADAGLIFIDGGHSMESALNDYHGWKNKICSDGALVIHDIFDDPKDGGQAPNTIYKKALAEGFELYERIDTTVCLTKV